MVSPQTDGWCFFFLGIAILLWQNLIVKKNLLALS